MNKGIQMKYAIVTLVALFLSACGGGGGGAPTPPPPPGGGGTPTTFAVQLAAVEVMDTRNNQLIPVSGLPLNGPTASKSP